METITELIAHPERLDKASLYELRTLVARYPYYQAARLLLLQNLYLLHDPQFGEELRKAALFVPDRRVMFQMVEAKNYEISHTPLHAADAQQKRSGDRTSLLIDDFLSTTDEPTTAPTRKLTAADVTSDYAVFLLDMEDAPVDTPTEGSAEPDRSSALIDEFIENKPGRISLQEEPEYVPELPSANSTESDGGDEGFLTMTLAKIYIKQQRYGKALEIIEKVNFNNPKKSVYFADQIRFLRKLILNQRHAESAKQGTETQTPNK